MNSVTLHSSLLFLSPSRFELQPLCCSHGNPFRRSHQLPPLSLTWSFCSQSPLSARLSPVAAASPSDEGDVSVIDFEDFLEKDWSFLDPEGLDSKEEHKQKISRIISAGEVESTSKVLVSIGSEGFVDQLVESSPGNLFVVHDSLLTLACIKEKYDMVKCWHGGLMEMPQKWAPFDAMFLYFLPALSVKLDQVLGMLTEYCSPGARLVISHPQGRKVLKEQQKQFPDVIVSDLPDKVTLQKVAADHSFAIAEFLDEPNFFLAVLKHTMSIN